MEKQNRLFEYRIKYYNSDGSSLAAFNSVRYYMAENAAQAFNFHLNNMVKHTITGRNLSVERKNPWNSKWEDVSEVINHQPAAIENED